MKPYKTDHGELKERQTELKEQQRTYWQNRMRSSKVFKMSRGATNIFRIIKDRFNWGEKDFPKQIKK